MTHVSTAGTGVGYRLLSLAVATLLFLSAPVLIPGITQVANADGAGGSSDKEPKLVIDKMTQGSDGNWGDGVLIEVGNNDATAPVTWRYVIKNTGAVPLTNVKVIDEMIKGPKDTPTVTPSYVSGDTNANNILDPGETWIYEAQGETGPGIEYANKGCVYTSYGETKDSTKPLDPVCDTSSFKSVKVEAAVKESRVISDRVWYDKNGNGVQDPGETGIAGATVRITGLDGQDVDPVTPGVQSTLTMLTGTDGKYLFSGLPAGKYQVDSTVSWIPYVDPDGLALRFTTNSSFTISVSDAGDNQKAEFGVVADTLPFTGLNTDTLLIAAIMLVTVGAGAVLLTTRRKDQGVDLAG